MLTSLRVSRPADSTCALCDDLPNPLQLLSFIRAHGHCTQFCFLKRSKDDWNMLKPSDPVWVPVFRWSGKDSVEQYQIAHSSAQQILEPTLYPEAACCRVNEECGYLWCGVWGVNSREGWLCLQHCGLFGYFVGESPIYQMHIHWEYKCWQRLCQCKLNRDEEMHVQRVCWVRSISLHDGRKREQWNGHDLLRGMQL